MPKTLPATQRYGLAVLSVGIALLLALLLQHHHLVDGRLSVFFVAIAVSSWYAGVGPSVLSILLSILSFIYFFAPPIYSFAFTTADVPAIIILVVFGILIAGFSAVRRRIERQLRQTRDDLEADIENRKRAEDALRRSEAYLAEAEKLSKTGSWAWSPVTRETLYWSDEMFRIFELDPAQGAPPAETFWQRVHPDDRDRVYEVTVQAALQKADYVHDHRIALPDGTVKHIHAIGHPITNAGGEVVQYIGTSMDVTERKRAEQARQELEQLWQAAFESNPTMYFIVDNAGAIASVNEFGAQQLGYTVSELVGQPVLNVFCEPDKQAVQGHARDCFAQPGRMMGWEARKIRKDGSMMWVRETANAVLLRSRLVLLVVCEDITEQKRAEEALRRSEAYLAEAQKLSHTGSWAYDPATERAIYWSEEMRRIYGLDPQGDTLPDRELFQRLMHPEDREKFNEGVEKAHREKAEFVQDYRIVLPDGTIKHLHEIGHPVLNEAGTIIEYVGTEVDVTELRRAEEGRERLRRIEAELARINRVSMMGELTASLGHEIKQPIAAAVSNAEACLHWLARKEPDLAEVREAAEEMVKEARRAAEIVTRVRSLFKKDELKHESVDINEAIVDTISLIRQEADRRSILVRTDLADALPTISADRVQLQQVLVNLMLNSLEAMTGARGEVTIRSQRDEEGRLLISVSDAGAGLPAGGSDKIFDAFFTTKPQGTGMGLAISRSIIESHGGRLWATSNSGPGATFFFTLPKERAAGA